MPAGSTQLKISHHIESLVNACEKLGLAYENLDEYSKQIMRVSYDDKSYIFGAGNICSFPINSATSTFLVKDKSHTINVLKKYGIATPVGDYFFIQDAYSAFRGPGKEKSDAITFANKLGYPLFVKPNDGSRGAFVEKVYNSADLQNYLAKCADKFSGIRIEKPLTGNEHRLFVIDGRIWFGYMRRPPFISFDGKNTVKQHILHLIESQAKSGHKSLSLGSSFIRESLKANALNLSSVPAIDEKLVFSPAMNLAMGGEVQDYCETFPDSLHNFAAKISEIFNLRVFGLDVYCDTDIEKSPNLTILEINGNPSLESADRHSNTKIVEKVWQYVIEETFK